MCSEPAVITSAVREIQDAELAAFLRRVFASDRWAMIRAAHPGITDIMILQRIIGMEALRTCLKGHEPVEFYASEFERCK